MLALPMFPVHNGAMLCFPQHSWSRTRGLVVIIKYLLTQHPAPVVVQQGTNFAAR